MLTVIDEAGPNEGQWQLLEEGDALFLNAYCSHSFIDYAFLMQLTADEITRFRASGRDYLTTLAYDVHWTAPIVKASKSPYKNRNLTPTRGGEVVAALNAWAQR
ncbi:hypothetical protein [Devosia sp. 2618]|uniref:hypothetical protein n=1 Tax=Devosia sp. 2618 TaxID=3156454 RepID=UPI003390879B